VNAESDEVMSIKDVADNFSKDLPAWQQKANLAWLTNLHGLMSDGGIWGSPNLGTVYQKKGDGWILLENFSDSSK
jgi:hypothetical protein